jgi:hypothetical protein
VSSRTQPAGPADEQRQVKEIIAMTATEPKYKKRRIIQIFWLYVSIIVIAVTAMVIDLFRKKTELMTMFSHVFALVFAITVCFLPALVVTIIISLMHTSGRRIKSRSDNHS